MSGRGARGRPSRRQPRLNAPAAEGLGDGDDEIVRALRERQVDRVVEADAAEEAVVPRAVAVVAAVEPPAVQEDDRAVAEAELERRLICVHAAIRAACAREDGVLSVSDPVHARQVGEAERLGVELRPASARERRARRAHRDLVSGNGSEIDQRGTTPGGRSQLHATLQRPAAALHRSVAERRDVQRVAGDEEADRSRARALPSAPGITSAGAPATKTSARSPANTTRIVNHSSIGKSTGFQKPGPW